MSKVFKAVGNAVSGVVKAVGSIVSGVVKAVGSIVSSVVNFVISPFLGLFGSPEMPSAADAESIKGVTVTKQGSDVSIPVVYGYRKVGGAITFCETGSDNNKYLYVAYVLCEGPIEGIRELWVDDIQVGATNIPNLNAQNLVPITDAASGKLKDRAQFQLIKGSAGNVGSVMKAGIFAGSPSWTTSMNYRGLAVLFARYEWINATDQATADQQPFSGSIPKIEVTVLGKKVTSLTSGTPENDVYGSDTQYFGQVYSMNPAEILLDYLRNARYGKGLVNADIDWASFKVAAAKYNQTVTYNYSGTTGPVQTLHAVVDTGQTIFNNVKAILQNSRSYLPYSRSGTYKLKVEDAGNPTDILSGSAPIVATFTKDNIVGAITYQGIERTSKYNQVCVTYTDPDQQWSAQQVYVPDTASAEHAGYLAEDGNRYNLGDFTFAWITNYAIAADMARLILMKSRNQDQISLTVTSEFMDLEVGDCVYIESNILKFGTDPNAGAICWRIVSTKLNNDYTVALGCVRNENELYPYVKQSDRDYKLSVYVPKGATRYYPPEPAGIPVGLKPPTSAPTTANDPNNPSDNPKINPTLTDSISIYKTTVALDSTNNNYATLSFNRPNNPTIQSVMFYYKLNVTDPTVVWNTLERPLGVLDAPDADGSFGVRIGPLVNGSWIIKSRIKYITGDFSSVETTTTFTVGTTTGSGSGGGGGGTVPTPPTNLASDFIRTIVGATVVQGTYPNQTPLNPRKIDFSITQDISTGANQLLNGIQVYYKPSANAKWYSKNIPVSVTFGTAVTFSLELGTRLYPLVQGAGAPLNADLYDFIFRYTYSDGKMSKWQYRAINQHVEDNGFSYSFGIFVAGMGKVFAKEDATVYIPELMGPNDVAETRNIVTPVQIINHYNTGTTSSPTNPSARMFLAPPLRSDITNWVGVRVYRHKAGVSGTGDYVDFTPADFNNVSKEYSVLVPCSFDETWEFVIVDLVYYGTSVVEAFNGQYISGYLHNRTADADYPSDYNWLNLFTVNAMEPLATAKAKLGTAIPKAIRNDTYFDSITAQTVLTSGNPSNPRKLSFTVKTSTANGTNGHVAKIRIYYKYNSNVYWKYVDYATTAENTNITFDSTQTTPAMNFGARTYPSRPFLADNFDFFFRIIYTDKTGSKYSPSYIGVDVEDQGNTSTYAFNPFGNRLFQPQKLWEDLVLEENAPPGAVVDPRNLTLSLFKIAAIGTGTATGRAQFIFNLPVGDMLPYFGGVRIYRKNLTAGSSDYTINNDSQPLGVFTTDATRGYAYQTVDWDVNYSYLLVPMVWFDGNLVEATNSLYWEGPIHNRETQTSGTNPYPAVTLENFGNWLSKRAAVSVVTETQKASLTRPVVVENPVVTLTSMKLIAGADATKNYYQVQYLKPATTTSVTIYRRSIVARQSYAGRYYNENNYWGAGRWEKIDFDDGGIAVGSTVTFNFRDATVANEFWYYYDPTITAANNTNPLYTNQTMTAPTNLSLAGMGCTQLLIVVNYLDGSTPKVSTQAIQVDCYFAVVYPTPNTTYTANVNSNSYLVNVADFNTITTVPASTNGTNILRKLTDARSVVPITNIIKPGTYATIGGWTYASTTPPVV